MTPLSKAPFIIILCILPLLFIQALWIFKDARSRGEKYYWLWGLYGLMNLPGSLIIYLIVTRILLVSKKIKK